MIQAEGRVFLTGIKNCTIQKYISANLLQFLGRHLKGQSHQNGAKKVMRH
jgi:hypothetical protein